MKQLKWMILLLCLAPLPLSAGAAGLDQGKPLLCAVTQAMQCTPDGNCQAGTAETFNLPLFIRVDLAGNKVGTTRTSGEKRETPIENIDVFEGKTALHGAENGRGWSMVIADDSGRMSATVSAEEVGFVVFGACTSF